MRMETDTLNVERILAADANRMLTPNHEYQRGAVWKPAQQKRLIDSLMRRYPIPMIYLRHVFKEVAGVGSRNDYEVIDGQQRITALRRFHEGGLKLVDPVANEKEARFPAFVKAQPCPWAGLGFEDFSEVLREQFLKTPISVVKVETDDDNEARDLFIRLQAGLPLNAQEKRDAWPGRFTDFVLRIGGKPELPRYPGHDFFRDLMRINATSRGKVRQLAAQMFMLFITRRESQGERLCDVNSKSIDDFYYTHLDFDDTSPAAQRFQDVLTRLNRLLRDGKRKSLQGHEAIHLVLLADALTDSYTPDWEDRLAAAFDSFRADFAKSKKQRKTSDPGEFYLQYGRHTGNAAAHADTIRKRHEFFVRKMIEHLKPRRKDPKRLFTDDEREIIYYRDAKCCQVCGGEVAWADADIHHVEEHAKGGQTLPENGVLVHRDCHPKGDAARTFAAAREQGLT